MNNDPGVAATSQHRRAATGTRRGSALNDAGPVEAVNASCEVRGLRYPDDVADPVSLVFNQLEISSDSSFDGDLSDMAGSVAKPIDGIVANQAESVLNAPSASRRFVFAKKLSRSHRITKLGCPLSNGRDWSPVYRDQGSEASESSPRGARWLRDYRALWTPCAASIGSTSSIGRPTTFDSLPLARWSHPGRSCRPKAPALPCHRLLAR